MAGGGAGVSSQQQAGGDVFSGGNTSRFTGYEPPSGYRPLAQDYSKPITDPKTNEVTGYAAAPQFYQPVYQPQYGGYASPFGGGYGGFDGGYGSPFGGFGGGYGGFGGGYGSPFGGFGGGYGGFDRGYGGLRGGYNSPLAGMAGYGRPSQSRFQRMDGYQDPKIQALLQGGAMPQRGIGQLQQTWSQQPFHQRLNFAQPASNMALPTTGVSGNGGSQSVGGDSGFGGGGMGGSAVSSEGAGLGGADAAADSGGAAGGEGGVGFGGADFVHGGITRLLRK